MRAVAFKAKILFGAKLAQAVQLEFVVDLAVRAERFVVITENFII